jgi:CRP-like cAMP-binding protein
MDLSHYVTASLLFKGLDGAEIAALQQVVSMTQVKKGRILFLDGDEATGFYVLFEGKVRIYKSNPEGKEYTIHIINPGQFFAEVAIFDGKYFPADCMAIDDSVVGFFPKDRFLKLIEEYPRISLKIIASLSRFLRDYNQMVEELALKEVSARLAHYLLDKSEGRTRKTIVLGVSKTELAKNLGTISETLSRNLKKLRDINAISVNGQEITIHDFDRLENIASGAKI